MKKTEAKINETNIVLPKIIPLFRVITFHCGSFCLILSKNLRFGFNLLHRLKEIHSTICYLKLAFVSYQIAATDKKNQAHLFLAEK